MTASLIRLKASLDRKTYRIIDIASTSSLEQLAEAIIDAYDFMFDHAFGFYDNIKNPHDSIEFYTLFADLDNDLDTDPIKGKSVRNTKVAHVFKKDKQMIFLFDYGDDWYFHIQCLDENFPMKKGLDYPQVIETKGTAPEQYDEE